MVKYTLNILFNYFCSKILFVDYKLSLKFRKNRNYFTDVDPSRAISLKSSQSQSKIKLVIIALSTPKYLNFTEPDYFNTNDFPQYTQLF